MLQRYAGLVIILRYRLAITGPSASWRLNSRNSAGLSWWPSCSSLAMVSSSISRGVMDSPLMVIGIILPARVILHWPEPLCVKSMRELHMLCVKLQLKMSCSGGNFFGKQRFGGYQHGYLAFGYRPKPDCHYA